MPSSELKHPEMRAYHQERKPKVKEEAKRWIPLFKKKDPKTLKMLLRDIELVRSGQVRKNGKNKANFSQGVLSHVIKALDGGSSISPLADMHRKLVVKHLKLDPKTYGFDGGA